MPVTTASESSVEPSSTTISSQSRWLCACTDSIAARTTVARFHSGITMLTSGWPSAPAQRRAGGASAGCPGRCRGGPGRLPPAHLLAPALHGGRARGVHLAQGQRRRAGRGRQHRVGRRRLQPAHQGAELGLRRARAAPRPSRPGRPAGAGRPSAYPRVVEVPEQRVAAPGRPPELRVEVLAEEQRMRGAARATTGRRRPPRPSSRTSGPAAAPTQAWSNSTVSSSTLRPRPVRLPPGAGAGAPPRRPAFRAAFPAARRAAPPSSGGTCGTPRVGAAGASPPGSGGSWASGRTG